jgi:hypothetical protein
MEKAETSEYFLEACWIQYAIIEDRFNSVIRHAYPTQGGTLLKSFRGLDRKMELIETKIHPVDEDCRTTVHKELISRIRKWKDRRNDLMHEITDSPSFTTIQRKVSVLAPEGAALVKELCARVRTFKLSKQKSSRAQGIQG